MPLRRARFSLRSCRPACQRDFLGREAGVRLQRGPEQLSEHRCRGTRRRFGVRASCRSMSGAGSCRRFVVGCWLLVVRAEGRLWSDTATWPWSVLPLRQPRTINRQPIPAAARDRPDHAHAAGAAAAVPGAVPMTGGRGMAHEIDSFRKHVPHGERCRSALRAEMTTPCHPLRGARRSPSEDLSPSHRDHQHAAVPLTLTNRDKPTSR